MRAAAYLRVSTDGQTVENQRLAVKAFCVSRGWELVRTYEETASGAAKVRPAYDRMRKDAVNGRGAGWNVLVVYRLDRLTRGGALAALDALSTLDRAGLSVASVGEPWLDTGGPFREVLIAFAAVMARMERETLVTRTKAGLDRARAEGKVLGRPRADEGKLKAAAFELKQMPMWRGRGPSLRDIAAKHGVGEGTLRRYLKLSGR